ncbi:MAG TPA: hypothetical protein PKN48_00970 [Bacteroidales bacterium]|nr:hypothetical protein [Bacteroidales bacterium]
MALDVRMLLAKGKQYGKQLVSESVESAKNLPHAPKYFSNIRKDIRLLNLPKKDSRVIMKQRAADALHTELIEEKRKLRSAMKLPLAGVAGYGGYKAVKIMRDPKIPQNYVEAPEGQYLTEEELLKSSAFDFRKIIGAAAAKFRNRTLSVAEQAATSVKGTPKIKSVASSFDAAKARATDIPFADVHSNVVKPIDIRNGIASKPKAPDVQDIKFKDVKPASAKASAPEPTIKVVPAPVPEPKKSGIAKYVMAGGAIGVGAIALNSNKKKKEEEY